jgi:transposase
VVCCDIWKPYTLTEEECFPNAEVVLYMVHIVKALNGVLNGERKSLRKEFKGEQAFKGIKWKLFKRPENCNAEEKGLTGDALDKSWILLEIYEMRNTFNSMFDHFTDKVDWMNNLELWMRDAEAIGNGQHSVLTKQHPSMH